jgi:Fic family protein
MDKYNWITFKLNLEKLPWHTWVRLGECAAKCQQIRQIPLKPAIKNQLHRIYLAKGVLATTAIEGNTLTEQQVLDVLDDKLKLPPSKEYLEQEIRNIIEACNKVGTDIAKGNGGKISVEQICEYNKMVLAGDVPRDEAAVPGQVRKHNVVVGNVYRPPDGKDILQLLEKFCEWLNSEDLKNKQTPLLFAIIKAVAAHLYFAWIHPFGDGNGRVARLLEFAILLDSGVPSPAAHLLSNHYNITRAEYYRQLDKAGKTTDPTDFITYAITGFLDGLNEQLTYIERHIMDTCWKDYVYERFEEIGSGPVIKRQRKLAIQISNKDEPVSRDAIILVMSQEYKNKTERTLARDLNKLEKMNLIVKTEGKYRVRKELMLQFLPFSTHR